MSLLRGRRYNRTKKAVGAPEGNKNRSNQIHQNDGIETTAERLAKQHGVSKATIERDGRFAEAGEVAKHISHLIGLGSFLGRAQHLSAIHKLPREGRSDRDHTTYPKNDRRRLRVTRCRWTP